MYRVLVFCMFFFISSVFTSTVKLKQGILTGTTLTARNGKLFNAYFGIPFAKPPIGILRFQSPVVADPWTGVLNASTPAPACVQINESTRTTIFGSEDCLNLNVFTPLDAKIGDNLPVIFYVYGGTFKTKSNIYNRPEYFMQSNIIMVHANYRGGALGFLSTGDTVIPGNFGLKDQVLALKWTKENIREFGGNPEQITLHGHSSGAMCVHFHTLSPLSKGLFNKVIIMSGSAYSSSSYFGNDVAKDMTNKFAILVECKKNSSQEMLPCFLELSPEVFAVAAEQMYEWSNSPDAIFRPTIEDEKVTDAFLTEDPHKASYQSPNLPWIIGMTSKEAAFFPVPDYLSNNGELLKEINDNYEMIFPITFQYLWNTKAEFLNNISRQIRNYYFKDNEISIKTISNVVDMYTHGLYGAGPIKAILAYPGKKYVYLFDHATGSSKFNKTDEDYLGVGHADEVNLFFLREKFAKYLNKDDFVLSDELIKRWTNFVYSGDPNKPFPIDKNILSFWEPTSTSLINYLRIKFYGSIENDPYNGVYNFWNSLPIGNKYY